jgi:RimJ/RimL family protein N-acetyltransferase
VRSIYTDTELRYGLKLLDVYSDLHVSIPVLWDLLKERTPDQSISHRAMPDFEEHCSFVHSKPYEAWYLIDDEPVIVGACYLTRKREIGIFIFKKHHGGGYGHRSVRMLMDMHQGRFIANMNPRNTASKSMFNRLGFKLIQHTYEKA